MHTAVTCIKVMKVLVASDKAHDIRKEKSPSGMVNAVEERLSYLGALVDSQHGDRAVYDEAYAMTYVSLYHDKFDLFL